MTRDAAPRRKCSDLCSRRGLRSRTSRVGGVDHPSGDRTGTLRPLGPRSVRLRARGNQPASLRPSIHSRPTPISADSQDCDGSIHCVLAGCSAAPSQHSFRPPHGNSSSLQSDSVRALGSIRGEHIFIHEGPLRAAKNCFLSAEGRGGARRTPGACRVFYLWASCAGKSILIGLRTGASAGFGHCGLVRRLSIKERTDAIGDGRFHTY